WVVMGVFFVRTGGKGIFTRGTPGRWQALCIYEFRPLGVEAVRIKSVALLHPELTDEPPQLVLYALDNPKHAALLSDIVPGFAFWPEGTWKASGGLLAVSRAAVIVLLIAGPILTWFFSPPIP